MTASYDYDVSSHLVVDWSDGGTDNTTQRTVHQTDDMMRWSVDIPSNHLAPRPRRSPSGVLLDASESGGEGRCCHCARLFAECIPIPF